MTPRTRETIDELYQEFERRIFTRLSEAIRYDAEKRLELNPHGETAYGMHAIANAIVIANKLGGHDLA